MAPERADAARNRRAILAAAADLLATNRPEDVSLEQVAAAAGVGKGTVFHRFGNRAGLMRALMVDRAETLIEATASGPPPLGPGAPARERLTAFLDALVRLIAGNTSVVAADDHAASTHRGGTADRDHPVYRAWHAHVRDLLAAERPDLDAELLGHVLLGALHHEPVLTLLRSGEVDRVSATLRKLTEPLLRGRE
jgi:AcrR family transcriptional regulator